MKTERKFNDCEAELNLGALSCVLKIRRKDQTPEGFIQYKLAIIAAARRLEEVIALEEKDHLPHVQDF